MFRYITPNGMGPIELMKPLYLSSDCAGGGMDKAVFWEEHYLLDKRVAYNDF